MNKFLKLAAIFWLIFALSCFFSLVCVAGIKDELFVRAFWTVTVMFTFSGVSVTYLLWEHKPWD